MKFLEKYKLYKTIMNQKPSKVKVSCDKGTDCVSKEPYIRNSVTYKVEDYIISATCEHNFVTSNFIQKLLLMLCWIELPVEYYSLVYKTKDSDFLVFNNSLLAKRLFEHGKKYSK